MSTGRYRKRRLIVLDGIDGQTLTKSEDHRDYGLTFYCGNERE